MTLDAGGRNDLNWSALSLEPDGGFKFSIERASEAIDVFVIPAAETAQLRAALQGGPMAAAILEMPDGSELQLIVLAWENWTGRDEDHLSAHGVTPRRIGRAIPSGDFLDYYPTEES